MKRILIANRGEIAVRVVRAARDLGLTSIVAYTSVDEKTLAVRLADEAYLLTGDNPRAGYLDVDQVLDLALRVEADAIHPGYGFLSENPALSRGCKEKGITFVGPEADVIAALGDKNEARALMEKAGLPLIPGTDPLPDAEAAVEAAQKIGFPVLIKAAGGGGGRGMRRADDVEQVRTGFEQARRESIAAFNNDRIYLEKYIEKPRHVEIQIIADHFGEVVYLNERECSIQRRFQKMVEEAPSPFLDPETRRKMGEAAVAGARDIGYHNAGTFEFLVDANKDFYFLEVNTRLQVEHPVTEEITGVDIVEEQLKVAQGKPLSFSQSDVEIRGWSIECRITCEDPEKGFAPAGGLVTELRLPSGPGVRCDTHLYAGYEVPLDFDSMVAKLITWGKDRDQAIRRMRGALAEFRLAGFASSIPFHRWVMENAAFVEGDMTTHFLEQHFDGLPAAAEQEIGLAALLAALESNTPTTPKAEAGASEGLWGRAARLAGVGGGARGFSR